MTQYNYKIFYSTRDGDFVNTWHGDEPIVNLQMARDIIEDLWGDKGPRDIVVRQMNGEEIIF